MLYLLESSVYYRIHTKDIKYFKYNIHGKVPQIRTYEIQEFMDGYIINYLYLLAQFLEQIMPQILCKIRPAFRRSWMTVCM